MNYRQLSPDTWAYLGDAIFEVLVRRYFIEKYGTKSGDLHRRTTEIVNAQAQANMVRSLQPYLTEEENEIVRRGRNSASRPGPKGPPVQDYRYSTGLEALFGYLYLQGKENRINELFGLGIGEE